MPRRKRSSSKQPGKAGRKDDGQGQPAAAAESGTAQLDENDQNDARVDESMRNAARGGAADEEDAKKPAAKRASEDTKGNEESSDDKARAPKKKPPPCASLPSSSRASKPTKDPEPKLSLYEQDKRDRKRRVNRITAQRKRMRERTELSDLKGSQSRLTNLNQGLAIENKTLKDTIEMLKKREEYVRQNPQGRHQQTPQQIQQVQQTMAALVAAPPGAALPVASYAPPAPSVQTPTLLPGTQLPGPFPSYGLAATPSMPVPPFNPLLSPSFANNQQQGPQAASGNSATAASGTVGNSNATPGSAFPAFLSSVVQAGNTATVSQPQLPVIQVQTNRQQMQTPLVRHLNQPRPNPVPNSSTGQNSMGSAHATSLLQQAPYQTQQVSQLSRAVEQIPASQVQPPHSQTSIQAQGTVQQQTQPVPNQALNQVVAQLQLAQMLQPNGANQDSNKPPQVLPPAILALLQQQANPQSRQQQSQPPNQIPVHMSPQMLSVLGGLLSPAGLSVTSPGGPGTTPAGAGNPQNSVQGHHQQQNTTNIQAQALPLCLAHQQAQQLQQSQGQGHLHQSNTWGEATAQPQHPSSGSTAVGLAANHAAPSGSVDPQSLVALAAFMQTLTPSSAFPQPPSTPNPLAELIAGAILAAFRDQLQAMSRRPTQDAQPSSTSPVPLEAPAGRELGAPPPAQPRVDPTMTFFATLLAASAQGIATAFSNPGVAQAGIPTGTASEPAAGESSSVRRQTSSESPDGKPSNK
ncbi:expressed unknown protein [Seminavis robusta]|uniref:BZIP domain-containing protein n=1 Tax=Seminavis robusta TaxID=568900 RepID=A0A9N8HLQ9_9STRA|nr:expressed unknown protein [Seminavis robusta]|eukprot:Sro1051_g235730.1 n/a (748) ;mRNA; r:27208-29451